MAVAATYLFASLAGHLASAQEGTEAFLPPLETRTQSDADGFVGTTISWSAGLDGRRSVHLVDNTQKDPTGHFGGYARSVTYPFAGGERICSGSNSSYPGFGMVVNHVVETSYNSVREQGSSSELLFAGQNHAIFAYKWRYNMSGVPVDITVHWLFATGQRSPIYAITFDTRANTEGKLAADTRAPYGDIDWDGGTKAAIDGIGWGDDKQFETLEGPVSLASGWDYSKDNVVPYVRTFVNKDDAEMGLVQTQTQAQHSAGGYSGFAAWGSQKPEGPMPEQSDWAYQLHQWQLPGDPTAKRVAWGSNFGAVGQAKYLTIGDVTYASGNPYQSYSVYIVNDAHSVDPVRRRVAMVQALQQGTLIGVDHARVMLRGKGGVGRTDDVTFDVAGLNPIYNTWELKRTHHAESMSFSLQAAADAAIERPTFVIHGLDHAPTEGVLIDGVLQRDQEGYFLSEDKVHNQLWLTLAGDVSGTTEITLLGLTGCAR